MRRHRRRPLRRPRGAPALGVLVVALVAGACSYQSRTVLPVTLPDEVESSTVYAADGTRLYTFHAEENRKVVALKDIPAHVREAVIAIEDERFYRHNGVDLRAVLRAVQRNTESGDIEEGGSTITQQYVKQELLRDSSQTVDRKLREATMALQLEREYSKDRILELYLNAIYFGKGAYGVEAAAFQFFGKSVGDLSLAEAALLAGQIQRPGATDPFSRPEEAVARRALVLERMRANGFASDAEIDAALEAPLELASGVIPASEQYAAPYFVEEVKRWILADSRFGQTARERRDLLFGGGLRIQTTVDLAAQQQAEAAVAAILPDPAGPDASLVAIEPATGHVRAMVGGRDFFGASEIAKLNLATRGLRQAGSSFKTFVLAYALAEGVDPETMISAPACVTIPMGDNAAPWRPCNYGGGGGGTVTLTEGTVRSYNTLYAQLIMRMGPAESMTAASRYGVRTPLQPVPSGVLGANVVSALDMAAGYATFANRGIKVPPILVTRITRADGRILFEHEHSQEKVLEAGVADTVTSILQQVIERGTGTRAKLDRPAAGKTGTTDDWVDAWFVGYTPELATAVWVGYPQPEEVDGRQRLIQMRPPRTPIRVTGGSYPAEIWQHFMSAALAGRPISEFTAPTTTTTAPVYRPPRPTAPPPQLEVPKVTGLATDKAIELLKETGFVVRTVPSPQQSPPDTVVVQSPKAGASAPAGSTVTLEVTAPPPTTTTTEKEKGKDDEPEDG